MASTNLVFRMAGEAGVQSLPGLVRFNGADLLPHEARALAVALVGHAAEADALAVEDKECAAYYVGAKVAP